MWPRSSGTSRCCPVPALLRRRIVAENDSVAFLGNTYPNSHTFNSIAPPTILVRFKYPAITLKCPKEDKNVELSEFHVDYVVVLRPVDLLLIWSLIQYTAWSKRNMLIFGHTSRNEDERASALGVLSHAIVNTRVRSVSYRSQLSSSVGCCFGF